MCETVTGQQVAKLHVR